ncbi:MAG TPA: helix-turn-helix transcriptional regulator [Clostridiaceae bacterium]|nr:helix-turn-helix transcriptional regulator [Clostridiaceae bacterium]
MDNYQPPTIGLNIANFRKQRNMSLDELSKRSGVSKSMLSQIEQEKSNPTIITVWKIARALGISIEEPLENSSNNSIEVLRREDSPIIFSDSNSCEIRANSPIHMTDNLELYYITFKPYGKHSSMPHFPKAEEFLTVISGRLKVSSGNRTCILNKGDTGRYRADQHHSIENLCGSESSAFLVVWFPK